MTEPQEQIPSPWYVVKVFTTRGALVFQGTVSQPGDYVELKEDEKGRKAEISVHDLMPTLTKPLGLIHTGQV